VIGKGLRRLDNWADARLHRHGTSLMGDHVGAKPSRSRSVVYAALLLIVTVARLLSGEPPGAVLITFVLAGLLIWFFSRHAPVPSRSRADALRGVRLSGLALVAIGVAFAFAGIWDIAEMLAFLAVFFNAVPWIVHRFGTPKA
jgi:hypothetical protein